MDSGTKNGRRTKRGGGRAYRSGLEPFVSFIQQQRQQRKTWLEIAELLRTEKGCAVTFQGLHQFYRRHLKRQARPHWEYETPASQSPLANGQSRKPVLAATPQSRPFRQPKPDDMNLNDPTNL